MASDPRLPRTAIDRGPVEEPLDLDPFGTEHWAEAGGDSAASDCDANVGGASATAGRDSGGAVGVRRGRAVGTPGFEYDDVGSGEADESDIQVAPTRPEEELTLEEILEQEESARWEGEGGHAL